MSLLARLQCFCLAHFSKPAADRVLFRMVRKQCCRNILEFNIGDTSRAARIIQVAQQAAGDARVTYSAIDEFELRPTVEGEGVSLKLAYRSLRSGGARIRLLPGAPYEVLARSANSLGAQDLILLSGLDPAAMSRAWFYLPRLLHAKTLVYERSGDESSAWNLLSHSEIEVRARQVQMPRRRAA